MSSDIEDGRRCIFGVLYNVESLNWSQANVKRKKNKRGSWFSAFKIKKRKNASCNWCKAFSMDPKWTNKNATQLRFVNGTHRDSTGTFSIERTLLGTNFGHDK